MDDNTKLQGDRRDFLGLAATVAAAGLGAIVPGPTSVAAADGPSTDFTRWLDSISGKRRQLYDMPEVNRGMGLVWSWAFFMTGPEAFGVRRPSAGAQRFGLGQVPAG